MALHKNKEQNTCTLSCKKRISENFKIYYTCKFKIQTKVSGKPVDELMFVKKKTLRKKSKDA